MGDRFRANIGLSYPPEQHADPGDIVDNLPLGSIPDLLAQGAISAVDEEGKVIDTETEMPEQAPPLEPPAEPESEPEVTPESEPAPEPEPPAEVPPSESPETVPENAPGD